MQTSLFIAKLIGPVLVVIGAGMLISPRGYRRTAQEFLDSRPLIYIAGLLALVPGLAIVLAHNLWTADWRIMVTLFGWLAVIGGAMRLLLPRQVMRIGKSMVSRPAAMTGAAIVVVALGVIFSFFGYAGGATG
jgi:hypothetical protein